MGADHSRAIVPEEDVLLPYKLNNTLGAFVEFTKQMTIPLEDESEETQETSGISLKDETVKERVKNDLELQNALWFLIKDTVRSICKKMVRQK